MTSFPQHASHYIFNDAIALTQVVFVARKSNVICCCLSTSWEREEGQLVNRMTSELPLYLLTGSYILRFRGNVS